MNRLIMAMALAGAWSCVTTASAQYFGGVGGAAAPWGFQAHASTAEEGIARGMSDIIMAKGGANLLHSEAAQNYQSAYSSYLDNRMKATQTYFDMRAVNKQARAAEAGPRATQADLARYAKSGAPSQLSASELDPLTGQISWPTILKEDSYKESRDRLNELYSERAKIGSLTSEQMQEAKQLADALATDLKANINNYPPQQYIQAKKFLDGVSRAAYAQQG